MDRLNELMFNYVNDNEIYDISDYSFFSRLSSIILDSKVPWFEDKIKNRFGITNSYKLAYEFFEYLDPRYASYFVQRANSEDIYLKYFKKNNERAYSFQESDGHKKIYLPFGRNFCDCFALVHEILHDMNSDCFNSSITRNLFTEYISIYGEMLLNDYVSSKYGIDFSANIKYTFNGAYRMALGADFLHKLLWNYLDKGSLNDYDVAGIINSYNPYYRGYLLNVYKNVIINSNFDFIFKIRYVIGVLFSCYTKDLVKEKRYDIDMFKFLNENINYLFPEDFCKMLDLDFVDESYLILSEESYSKLKKSYCKHMR